MKKGKTKSAMKTHSKVENFICSIKNVWKSIITILSILIPEIAQKCGHNYTQLKSYRINGIRSACSNGWEKFQIFLPFLWPKSRGIKCRVLICMFLVLMERFSNVMIPIYNQKIVDSLEKKVFRWDLILLSVVIRFVDDAMSNARSFLWTPVGHFTSNQIQVRLFAKLHNKSLRWHLARQTGEVLLTMDRGKDGIKNFLDNILFSIIPQAIDIFGSLVFFSVVLNWYLGVIVIATMWLYIRLTKILTDWRKIIKKRMNGIHDGKISHCIDSLLNFETVKYYGAEQYEIETYRKAVSNYQKDEMELETNDRLLQLIQETIVSIGLLSGSLLCAYMVVDGTLTSSHYVLFASYIYQLYYPLNWLGKLYKEIQNDFNDMKNMFELLEEEQEIKDAPDAEELCSVRGEIEFTNVTFGYTPERTILKNISFSVPAGKTMALVGPSGSGKSTIIRLLFRFYDVNDGSISIDGKNIKNLQQQSLRHAIGVVPQDTILFNSSIKYNIQYGRLSASEEDVIAAARAADIHKNINNFPEKYETEVGERGLRLSGGEKQRVAIARTILKAPSIVLLDEATSALDTQTERNIQAALRKVCENKTSIIVAHRLSTITHADEIIVLKEGEIVEHGPHEKLLVKNGIYADMWNQQFQDHSKESTDSLNNNSENHKKTD